MICPGKGIECLFHRMGGVVHEILFICFLIQTNPLMHTYKKKKKESRKRFCSIWLEHCQHACYDSSEVVLQIHMNHVVYYYDSESQPSGDFTKGERLSWEWGGEHVFGQALVLCCPLCYVWGGIAFPKTIKFRWILGWVIPWVGRKARVQGYLIGASQTWVLRHEPTVVSCENSFSS